MKQNQKQKLQALYTYKLEMWINWIIKFNAFKQSSHKMTIH